MIKEFIVDMVYAVTIASFAGVLMYTVNYGYMRSEVAIALGMAISYFAGLINGMANRNSPKQ